MGGCEREHQGVSADELGDVKVSVERVAVGGGYERVGVSECGRGGV